MISYYVSTTTVNGEHELHRYGCPHTPAEDARVNLGEFLWCRMALIDAAARFVRVNGCAHCTPECHTTVAIDASAA